MRTNFRRQRQWLLEALACALLGGNAQAAANVWSGSTPDGGDVRAFAVDPLTPATVYAGTLGGGVFKSTDAGGTWSAASVGLAGLDVVALAVNPAVPTTVYTATYSAGVFKSTDAGATWSAASAGLPMPRSPDGGRATGISIDPLQPATLYYTGYAPYGGVYKSTDAGASWVVRMTGITGLWGICSFAVSPSTPTTLYAGTCWQGDGIFKSTDGGDTWALANGGLGVFTDSSALVLAVDPSNPAVVYVAMQDDSVFKSTNGGATWGPSHTGLPGNPRALAIDPSAPSTLYAGTVSGAGVYKSTNAGATWAASDTGPTSARVHALALVPGNPSTLYAGAESGALKSTNAAGSWSGINAGITNSSFYALAQAPSNPALMYAGRGVTGTLSPFPPIIGLFRSSDAGSSWLPASVGLPLSAVNAVAVDPTVASTVYAGTALEGVYKSTDAGDTWSPAAGGIPAGFQYKSVRAFAVDPLAPLNVYAGTAGGICKSTDGGVTWVISNSGLTPVAVSALAIHPTTPSVLYAGTDSAGVYKSTDSGATWSAANAGFASSPIAALALDPATPGALYAGVSSGTAALFRSTNSGATWAASGTGLPSGTVNAIVVSPASGTLYAGTRTAGVFKSTNQGVTWAPVNKGLPPAARQVQALLLDAGGSTTLYAGVVGVGIWQASPPPPAFVKGDLNGDGQPDLVFRSNVDGTHNKAWLMAGVARAAEAAIAPDAASADWTVRGVDDFDGDGGNDLVFRSQTTGNVEIWSMNGTNRAGLPRALANGAVLDPVWDLAATADFDRDGRADIVWRNVATQKIEIWKMGGTAQIGLVPTTPDQAVDGNWIVVATLDYNDDGNTDFLWYNFSSGKIVTWYMDWRVQRTAGQFTTPSAAGDANWKVVASADYSGTATPATPPLGSPDIVWRNETSGNQVVWHMNFASTRVHGEFSTPAANTPALDWTIVGPR